MKQLPACFSKQLEDGINSPLRFMTQGGHANYKRTTLGVLQPKSKTNGRERERERERERDREREVGGGGVGFITS